MTQVKMILGSKSFLKHYFNEYDTPLVLLKSLVKGHNYALLDQAGAIPFVDPLTYDVIAQAKPMPQRGVFQFMHFRLTAHDAPLMADKAKRLIANSAQLKGLQSMALWRTQGDVIEYVLATCWQTQLDVFSSKRTPLVTPVLSYVDIAANEGGYYDRTYQAIDPNADDDEDNVPEPAES